MDEICFIERHCRVKYGTEIFGRQGGYYGFGGRGGRKGLTTLEVC